VTTPKKTESSLQNTKFPALKNYIQKLYFLAGDQGFFKIRRGINLCGIAGYLIFPDLASVPSNLIYFKSNIHNKVQKLV
jgi:hypothetical protein